MAVGCMVNWSAISAIASLVAAGATILYTIFTYKLLKAAQENSQMAQENLKLVNDTKLVSNKLAEFQIYTKLTEQLYSSKAVELKRTIEQGGFQVLSGSDKEPVSGKVIYDHDLTQYLLNPLEDLAKFYSDGLISADAINTGFGSLILLVGCSAEIANYIKFERKRGKGDDGLYGGLEELLNTELGQLDEDERKKYHNPFT